MNSLRHEKMRSEFAKVGLDILRQEGCLIEVDTKMALSTRGRRFSSLVADLLSSVRVRLLAASYG